jgi:hypothetical protein
VVSITRERRVAKSCLASAGSAHPRSARKRARTSASSSGGSPAGTGPSCSTSLQGRISPVRPDAAILLEAESPLVMKSTASSLRHERREIADGVTEDIVRRTVAVPYPWFWGM